LDFAAAISAERHNGETNTIAQGSIVLSKLSPTLTVFIENFWTPIHVGASESLLLESLQYDL
jgi:hypothetical protein